MKIQPPLTAKGNTWQAIGDMMYGEFIPGLMMRKGVMTGTVDAMAVIAKRTKQQGFPEPQHHYTTLPLAPPGIEGLRDYQLRGVARVTANLVKDHGAILADDMGLGKSVQTIAVWNSLKRPYPLLVVAPASVRTTWRKEFKKWCNLDAMMVTTGAQAKAVPKDTPVVITSYELAKKLGTQFTPHMLVMDEAHLLRGRMASRGQHLLELANLASYKLALTGTPMWSRPRDFWMLLKILFGYRFGTADDFDFAYCGAYQNQWGGKENRGATRLDELKLRLQYVMLRRTKEDVSAELPPMTRQIRWVPVTKEAKVATEAAALKQIPFAEALKATLGAKMDAAMEAAKSAGKFLLFTWMKAHAEQMYQELLSDGYDVELITGDITHAEREAAIQRAQQRGASVVASIDSSNAGIDGLQHVADTVVFHHLDYVPIKMAQAEARLHRIGQKNPVTVIYIAMEDSADVFVVSTVIDKLDQWRASMGNDSTAAMNDTLSQQNNDYEKAALAAIYASMEDE